MDDTMQALFPVQLPRGKTKDQQEDEYNNFVAQNENNLQQNLANLYNKLLELEGRMV